MANLLVVDDDQDILETLKIGLTFRGHHVTCASDGRMALDESHRECPDLVVLDMSMPEMDGIEVCRQLRASDDTANVPILFLSANGTLEGQIAGFNAKANDYMIKPFDLRELDTRIQTLLRYHVQAANEMQSQFNVGDLVLNRRACNLLVQGVGVPLTPIEFDLMRYLMSRVDQVVSTEELLQNVWHFPANTNKSELVRAHVKNLRTKIERDSKNPIYLKTVGHSGYMIASAHSAQALAESVLSS
jgi:DNA-binding response OmpR family regulator